MERAARTVYPVTSGPREEGVQRQGPARPAQPVRQHGVAEATRHADQGPQQPVRRVVGQEQQDDEVDRPVVDRVEVDRGPEEGEELGGRLTPSRRAWGIAMPWPSPVDPSRSRLTSACSTVRWSSASLAAARRATSPSRCDLYRSWNSNTSSAETKSFRSMAARGMRGGGPAVGAAIMSRSAVSSTGRGAWAPAPEVPCSRAASRRGAPRWDGEPVADPRFGDQDTRVGSVGLDLMPEPVHEDAQVLDVVDLVRSPHVPQDVLVGQQATGVAGQQVQQLVFPWV